MADRATPRRRAAYGNRFVRAGLPLVTLVVVGWFGLAQLVQVRAAPVREALRLQECTGADVRCVAGQD
jgi:hypothetical protein